MDARSFLGLEPAGSELHFRLPVVPGIASPAGSLFGGCGLAAGVAAAEQVTGRPTLWAAAQYLSFARVGTVVDFEVVPVVVGNHVTQARVHGRVDGEEIITVLLALGGRPVEAAGTWVEPPDVPGPLECPPRSVAGDFAEGNLLGRVDMRVAIGRQWSELDGTPGDGHCAFWTRLPGQLEVSAATLAVVGDFVPSGIANALGRFSIGSSLDNTIRVVRLVPTGWVLCDIRVEAVQRGVGHGTALLWSEDGTLMATASQSSTIRFHLPPPGATVSP